ncbi:MAG: dTDP-glucose 4,6-dehydratase [Bacteroidales bacterium]|nr:dTDP-glucose 4,6-dehydratase [Bacteroidales bacterium]
MKTFDNAILITGGAGFIGSHVVRLFVNKYPDTLIINLDKLTYAGNLENLTDIEDKKNYLFVKGDIMDEKLVISLFEQHPVTGVIHLAAESHVDRSITNPLEFIGTNVIGTVTLLNACRDHWKNNFKGKCFYQISTDEVYGSLGPEGYFTEDTPYDPQSPYSASKAGADHFVRAYGNTYNLPFLITNCSNNYGPNQFPEKLIPLTINNILHNRLIPVYGKGENIRDWLYVVDHARAIDLVYHKGDKGETYNIGGNNEWKNINLVYQLCDITDKLLGRAAGTSHKLITFVKDRAGHDLRYAIDSSKIRNTLGWMPETSFEEGLTKTIQWYLDHQDWLHHVLTGEYEKYYEQQYLKR